LPKHQQGFTLFFTGLSGAGKTTLAQALIATLMTHGKRNITLLDGDVVRRILANELGFSKTDRDLNIRRIGFVASEVTKAGGIVICAAIAPYQDVRMENRHLISQHGGYIEIYLSTPFDVCEKRDTKGLYAKAKRGEIQEIMIDTSKINVEEAVSKIIRFLNENAYLKLVNLRSTKEEKQSLSTEPA
jgi:sulfate adenylyltransferase